MANRKILGIFLVVLFNNIFVLCEEEYPWLEEIFGHGLSQNKVNIFFKIF